MLATLAIKKLTAWLDQCPFSQLYCLFSPNSWLNQDGAKLLIGYINESGSTGVSGVAESGGGVEPVSMFAVPDSDGPSWTQTRLQVQSKMQLNEKRTRQPHHDRASATSFVLCC